MLLIGTVCYILQFLNLHASLKEEKQYEECGDIVVELLARQKFLVVDFRQVAPLCFTHSTKIQLKDVFMAKWC